MAPQKKPKGEQKLNQNNQNDQTKKKQRKTRQETYHTYIYKVLKTVHPDLGISKKAIEIINSLINDIFERIATESITLLKLSNKRTLKSREIHNAIILMLPENLLKYAMSEGVKAVQIYLHGQTSMFHF